MPYALQLLGSFGFVADGRAITLPLSAQRLLALLALERRSMARGQVAGMLWPDKTEVRAAANLRSALWRLNNCVEAVVAADHGSLTLSDHIDVDVHQLLDPHRPAGASPFISPSTAGVMVAPPSQAEVLIDWDDEWVIIERERVRQQTLRTLEHAVGELGSVGRYAEAIDLGETAIRLAPLRESAHRVVIGVHLAEGNYAEAVRSYETFSGLIFEAFGIGPSEQLTQLLDHQAHSPAAVRAV